ncbi:TonB-dependent receptor plug domain-containing protein [Povalibacter sp.]|uniref:TonB-dependent receptor plug domain-containing protein n=1 Tax=Povalibacter sp. TaxID=1962978 RepID=UPI002F40DD6A
MQTAPSCCLGRRRSTVAVLAALSTLIAVESQASDATSAPGANETLDYIIVNASRIPKAVIELTNSVTIIDEATLQQGAFTDLTEVLRMQPGLEFKQAGGPGQFTYPKMRGLPSQSILVVIDGIKVNSGGSGDVGNLFGQLDVSAIENIEILRGPQATLYGANSTAGVIAITTKSGARPGAGIDFEAGSLEWKKASASFRGNTQAGDGEFRYSFNGARTDSGGVKPGEGYEDVTGQLKLDIVGGVFEAGVSAFYSDSEFQTAELDEAYCCQTYDSHWAFQTRDPHNDSLTEQYVIGGYVKHNVTDNLSHTLRVGYTTKEYENIDLDDGLLGYHPAPYNDFTYYDPFFNPVVYQRGELVPIYDDGFDIDAFYEDKNKQYTYDWLYRGGNYNVIAGIERLEQEASQAGTWGALSGSQATTSLFMNGDMGLFDRALTLAAGVRRDDFDSWGAEVTGNVGAAWFIAASNTTVYANYGTSYAAPTMSQLFSTSYGNINLQPESGTTLEVGIRQSFGDLSFDAAYWDAEIEDVIFFDYTANNPANVYGAQYNNGSMQRSRGVEFATKYTLTDSIELYGNYTYTDSENQPYGGAWLDTVQIAPNKANLGVRLSQERWGVTVNSYYSDERLRWAGDLQNPSYVRVDLSGRFNVTDRIELHARIENILDREIVEEMGYEQPGVYGIFGVSMKLN